MPNIQKTFPVTDMMCVACATAVEDILKNTEGVHQANVNYATHNVHIQYDSEIISAEKLKERVEQAGYGLHIEAFSEETLEAEKEQSYKKLVRDFFGSLCVAIPIFCIEMFHWHFPFYSLAEGFLASLGIFFGKRFFIGAYKQFKNKSANMDTLVALSTGVGFLYSWFLTAKILAEKQENLHLYFESVTMVLCFVLLGKVLEARAKGKTSEAIKKLMQLKASSVFVKKNEEWIEIPLKEVCPKDIVLVKAGQKIPIDGKILSGESFVDESMLTGESIPIRKTTGENVFEGTINQFGTFEIIAEKVGNDTLLASIIRAVEEAQGSKAPIQLMVDKVSRIFVPIILIIALISFFSWTFFSEKGVLFGLQTFVCVLVVACPCALGLATPTALIVGIGKAAEKGILIKNAECLELAKNISAVVFDKTGTLTEGKPSVVFQYFTADFDCSEAFVSLEKYSQHPLAKAITTHFQNRKPHPVTDFSEIIGKGVQGRIRDEWVRIGSLHWLSEFSLFISEEMKEKIALWEEKATLVVCFSDEKVLGMLAITDAIKTTSPKAIKELQSQHIQTHILTGDNLKNATSVGNACGIPQITAEVSPSEKQAYILKLQKQGEIVAMIGDGINDTQALAQADVSIAMGKGSDIAMEVAQITLVGADLLKIPMAIRIAKKTTRTIRENLFWAFIYNLIAIPLATGLFYSFFGFLINPMWAAAAMAFSSISVVTNSLLLKKRI